MSEFFQTFVRLRSQATGAWLVSEDLRPKLVADATQTDSNLTEVVIRILSERYKVAFEPSGRKTKPSANGEELNLRLPMPLYRKIAVAAAGYPRSVQAQILADLCMHYGLAATPTAPSTPHTRRRRNSTRAAAA